MEKYIPWVISGLSLLFVILTYVRNGNRDRKSDEKEDDSRFDGIKESLLKANLKLDQVCSTTTETRSDIKVMNKDLQGLDRRVVILERDMKTVFNTIEDLKK